MTVLSVKTGTDPEVLTVGLSDGSFFCLRAVYLRTFRLCAVGDASGVLVPGVSVEEEEREDLAWASSCFDAEKAALSLVARSEQVVSRLILKLRARGFDRAIAETVVDRLKELGLVDDERFACLWLQSRMRRRAEGRSALLAGLVSRGVGREASASALGRTVTPEVEDALLLRFLEEEGLPAGNGDFSKRSRLRDAVFSPRAIRDADRSDA